MRPKEFVAFGRQFRDQSVGMAVIFGDSGTQELSGTKPSQDCVRSMGLADANFFNPFRRISSQQFLALLVKEKESDVLRIMNWPEVKAGRFHSSRLISLDSAVEVLSLAGLHARNFSRRTGRQRQ